MDLIADTNLIVDLERESRRSAPAAAHAFLQKHREDRFFITFTTSGELACGESAAAVEDWQALCEPYVVLPWTDAVSERYGQAYRILKRRGLLIGTNDLWIAATALAYGMPVVTNNRSEFERVPGLQVLAF